MNNCDYQKSSTRCMGWHARVERWYDIMLMLDLRWSEGSKEMSIEHSIGTVTAQPTGVIARQFPFLSTKKKKI